MGIENDYARWERNQKVKKYDKIIELMEISELQTDIDPGKLLTKIKEIINMKAI